MKIKIMLALTLLLSGRAMTLAFIHRAGGIADGDPPAAWLMPLLGDAAIGISAIFVAYLIWKVRNLSAWTAVLVWNSLAIWDACSAFIINLTNPWPEFFMLELIGPTMFFAASIMHAIIIFLACRQDVRDTFFSSAPAGREST